MMRLWPWASRQEPSAGGDEGKFKDIENKIDDLRAMVVLLEHNLKEMEHNRHKKDLK